MNQAEINGIELLTESEKRTADKLLKGYLLKIQRQLKNIISLKLYIKQYKKEGKGKKYSVDAEVSSSTRKLRANAHDWNFARTLHKVMNKLISEIEHEFHVSEQH